MDGLWEMVKPGEPTDTDDWTEKDYMAYELQLDGPYMFGEGMGQKIFGIISGESKSSMLACCDIGGDFACPNYFQLLSDGKKMYITLESNSCHMEQIGQDFEFKYKYDKKKNRLWILIDDFKWEFKPYEF